MAVIRISPDVTKVPSDAPTRGVAGGIEILPGSITKDRPKAPEGPRSPAPAEKKG